MARTPKQRHIRHGHYGRTKRSDNLRGFLAEQQTDLNGTGTASTFTGAAGQVITITAHNKLVGDGPYLASSTGALPAPLQAGVSYWIAATPNANTLSLSSKKGGPVVTLTGAGTGTHTLTKASDADAMYDYLKQNGPAVLKNATDVDTL